MPRSRDQEIIELLSSLCIPGSAKQYWRNTKSTSEIYLFSSIWVALNLLFWSVNSRMEYQGSVLFFHYKHITIKVVKQCLQTLDNVSMIQAWSIREGEKSKDRFLMPFISRNRNHLLNVYMQEIVKESKSPSISKRERWESKKNKTVDACRHQRRE